MSAGEPLRIALVVHTFDTGGLERCMAHLINRLPPEHFAPALVCLVRNGTAARWLERSTVPTVELGKGAGNDPRIIGRLAGVLRELGADVVHSHNWGTLVESALAVRRLPGVAHVHAEHGLELDEHRVTGWRRELRRIAMGWAMRRAARVVACAHCVRAWIVDECRVPASRVEVLLNGVDPPAGSGNPDASRACRDELGIAEDTFVFGSVGRLIALKDFESCVAATAELAGRGRDVHCVLVGDGPERPRLDAAAERLGVTGRVHLVGRRDDVGYWLEGMDVYVNSSRTEAMNMALLEAMSVGLPVVATDVGDSAQIVLGPPACGVVIRPGSVDALVGALETLLAERSRLEEAASAALARYRSAYTVDAMVARYASLYRDASAEALGAVSEGRA